MKLFLKSNVTHKRVATSLQFGLDCLAGYRLCVRHKYLLLEESLLLLDIPQTLLAFSYSMSGISATLLASMV